jgi:valyl-tRNA synthetase
MPKTKNQAKNKSRFEIRGGVLNEYEFALNEGAMTEEERNRFAQAEEERQAREGQEAAEAPLPTSPQEREAARIREVMETAHEKAQRNIEKRERQAGGGKRAQKGAAKRASKAGKKAGAKGKVLEKSGTITSSRKAGAGKKGSAQKRGAVKGAKKGTGKKGAKKSGGTTGGGAARKGGAGKGAGRKASTKKGGRTRST